MTVFEIFFGLTAVVLGLALTHLAASVHHLLVARGRVRWAPEPILLAILVLVVIVFVWLNQWELRNETSVTMGEAMLQVLKLLVLYLAASFVLPAPGPSEGPIDLADHYARSKVLTYGALILSLLLFVAFRAISSSDAWTWQDWAESMLYPAIYTVLIFVRWRWLSLLILGAVLIWYGLQIAGYSITAQPPPVSTASAGR